MGNCLYHKKQFKDATPLLMAAIDSGIKHNNAGTGFVSDAYLTLGKIALEEGHLAEANRNLILSRYFALPAEEYFRIEQILPILAKLAQKNNNMALMSAYLDSAITVKDSMSRKMNALFVLRGTQKATLLKQQKLEADKRLKTTQRNFLIAFILIATLCGMYIFYIQRKRFQQKQAMDQLRLQQNEQELQLAIEQLNAFANTISEKNRLLEELEVKLGNNPKIETLTELKESTILTEEQWERFRKLFDQVHKGYIVQLKEKLPDLTQAEIRFMVLAKLKFSNKEMAGALNISTQAIRTTWYRLRKKLHLPEEGSLDELVEKI